VSGSGPGDRPLAGSGPVGLRLAAAIAALVTFGLARATLLPGVAFWDTGEFQTVGPVLGTAHPTGYPAYVILGWLASIVLAPLGEPAFRMNLLAAFLAAATAALVVAVTGQLTRRPLLALATGLVFGMLPVSWRLATHADPHGFHVALVALLLVLLLAWQRRRTDRWLLGAAVVAGVAAANHSLTLFLVPGVALFVVAVEPRILERGRRRVVLRGLLVAALTAGLLYLELPLRAGPFRAPLVYGAPDTFDGFWYVVLGLQFSGLVAPFGHLGTKLGDLVSVAVGQLGPLALLIPAGLLATAIRRPHYALLTAPPVVLTGWFAVSYVNAEIDRYYLGPALIVLTWIAILADGLLEAAGRWLAGAGERIAAAAGRAADAVRSGGRIVATPGPGRLVALEALAAVLLLAPSLGALPTRWASVDRSSDREAARWLDQTLAQLAPGAVVVSWWDFSTALWYAQLCQGRRPDIRIVDDRTRLDEHLGGVIDVIDADLGRRPVYLIRPPTELAELGARYRLELLAGTPFQPVVRVVGRTGAGAGS